MQDFEDIYEALKATVAALGGTKQVASRMRPTLEPLKARSWLLNCLNHDHPMKFDPEEVQWIWRAGCDVGFHDGKHWADHDAHYEPSAPCSVEAQLADCMRVIQSQRRSADEAEKVITAIKDNPKLRAVMAAANIDVEALLQ